MFALLFSPQSLARDLQIMQKSIPSLYLNLIFKVGALLCYKGHVQIKPMDTQKYSYWYILLFSEQ